MSITMLGQADARSRLGVGLQPRRWSGDPNAWKRALGNNNRVPARLEMLPDAKPRWNLYGASAAIQTALLLFLLMIPLLYPERLRYAMHYDVMPLATPLTEVPIAPPPPKPKPTKPKIEPLKPKQEVVPQPDPPKVVKIPTPKFEQPILVKPKKLEVKAPEINKAFEEAKLAVNTAAPKRPKDDVKLDNLSTSTGSAAPATLNLPVNKVQTGGFGDENGLPGPGDPNKRANVNAKGSPLLPGGPGYGNGTGGATGARGTVASTGFGNGVAIPPPAAKRGGTVQSTGFSDATTAVADAPKKKAAPTESATTPVDILEKPRPEYTAEGRKQRIEGDVTLEVVFLASGQVTVNRVVSGLGHGLDEAATRAAEQIKFKPAKREGQPVDFPARVRIEFRLAY